MDRTKAAFDAMVGTGVVSGAPSEYLRVSYASGVTDEFIRPACFDKSLSVKPEDSIVFFNFRKDRMKQLSKMFRESLPETEMVSFTEYEPGSGIPAAFSLIALKIPYQGHRRTGNCPASRGRK
jgi:2,3-bisphosphoglycerate-independent phosphoglycerate mutase